MKKIVPLSLIWHLNNWFSKILILVLRFLQLHENVANCNCINKLCHWKCPLLKITPSSYQTLINVAISTIFLTMHCNPPWSSCYKMPCEWSDRNIYMDWSETCIYSFSKSRWKLDINWYQCVGPFLFSA